MSGLLHLAASPRGDRSHSLAVANVFIAAYRDSHPGQDVETIDLWAAGLPSFDGETIAAKYAILGAAAHTPPQAAAWATIRAHAERFKAASHILLSVPMWNFGIPYVLKHYIDVITQPGLTFSFSSERGFEGLVTGRGATIISASAGAYHQGSGAESADFERPYLEHWLRFVGFTDIRTIAISLTLGEPAAVQSARQAAGRDASTLAQAA